MPRIPEFLAREPLPGTSGIRGGGTSVPVVGQPGAAQQGPGPLEGVLGAIPESLQATAGNLFRSEELVLQREELEAQREEVSAQRQKAQDVLDSTLGDQAFAQKFQASIAQLQQGDYRQFPEGVVQAGNDLLESIASERNLTPQAKAFLTAKAQERITVAQQNAFTFQSRRRDQDKTYALSLAVQEAQEWVANAGSPYERQVALGKFDETLNSFAATGLAEPGALANLRRQTLDAVTLQDVRTEIQADPAAMHANLLAQARNEPTREDLPLGPMSKLPELIQEAAQVAQQQLGRVEHAERMADYRLGKQQEQTANDVRAKLSVILPTPDNIGQYDDLLADVNKKATGPKPEISSQAHREFTEHIRVLRAAAAKPREIDDAKVLNRLTIMIDAASNDRDYEDVRGQVIMSAPMLKPESTKSFLNQIYERKSSGHYSKLPGFQEGIRILVGADVAEGTYMAMLKGSMQEAEAVRLRTALDIYRQQMQRLAAENRDQANADGPQIARDIWHTYLDVPAKEEKLKRLPLPLQGPDGKSGVLDEATADAIIAKMSYMNNAQKQRTKDQWTSWHKQAIPTPEPVSIPAEVYGPPAALAPHNYYEPRVGPTYYTPGQQAPPQTPPQTAPAPPPAGGTYTPPARYERRKEAQ